MIFNATQLYAAKDYLIELLNSGADVRIEKYRQKRSIDQNSLMWLWLTCIEKTTGNDCNSMYEYYCEKFLLPITKEIRIGKNIIKIEMRGRTSTLDTLNMKIFLDKLKLDAEENITGLELPNPEDKHFKIFREYYKQFI